MNRLLVCVVFLFCLMASPQAQIKSPANLNVDGRSPLSLAAHTSRLDLLGAVELYTVALYTDGARPDRRQLMSPDMAKALRIQVVYDEDPRRRTAIDWRRELVPRLEGPATAHIQGSFAPIQHGDVIVIEYVPSRGTTVRVNKGIAVSEANHDLMLAFLDHWLGQRPLSEEIKQALLAS
jgi:Chalcone isomerase-like